MICQFTIPSTSNTINNLLIHTFDHSSYKKTNYNNDQKTTIISIFTAHVFPQIKEIHHPALFQEWKLNLESAMYEKNIENKT